MKIVEKMTEIQKPVEPIRDGEVDNKLELLKYTSEVQSRIRDDISPDFTLAKLSESDKEGIIEMTSNAYFCKKIGKSIEAKAKEIGKWSWDNKTRKWRRVKYSQKYVDKLNKVTQATFDAFMTRIYMTVILNRNVNKNYLIKILAGMTDADEQDDKSVDLKSFKDKLKKVTKNEESVKEQV